MRSFDNEAHNNHMTMSILNDSRSPTVRWSETELTSGSEEGDGDLIR